MLGFLVVKGEVCQAICVFIHLPLPSSYHQLDRLLSGVHDQNLVFTLAFGIGLHHAGLHERDRRTVEELFVNQKIQVSYSLVRGLSLGQLRKRR